MPKDKKAKDPGPQYDVDALIPGFRILENVEIVEVTSRTTRLTYRRQRSGYRDEQVFSNDKIVGIYGPASGEAGGSTAVVIEPRMSLEEFQRRTFKLKGAVEETDEGFLEITSAATGAVSFINPLYAFVKRPDDEANASVPKRGRRPKPRPEEPENVPSQSTLLKKKKKKDKLKNKVRKREDTGGTKRSRDW